MAPRPPLVAACLLTACVLGDNPAYKSTGTADPATTDSSGATTTATTATPTSTDATTTGGTTTDLTTATTAPTCPDGQPPEDYWPDADEDGYGDAALAPVSACDPPAGHVPDATDCDDLVDAVHPHAEEVCNNADDDCDDEPDGPECDGCTLVTTPEFVYWVCVTPEEEPGLTWQQAEQRCEAFVNLYPVDLLSIHSPDEYADILPTLETVVVPDDQGSRHAWIGLTKLPDLIDDCAAIHPTDDWEWSDDTEVDVVLWNDGEPSNQTGLCLCGNAMCPFENCTEIKLNAAAQTTGWNDIPCEVEFVRAFVCKTPRDPDLFPLP